MAKVKKAREYDDKELLDRLNDNPYGFVCRIPKEGDDDYEELSDLMNAPGAKAEFFGNLTKKEKAELKRLIGQK